MDVASEFLLAYWKKCESGSCTCIVKNLDDSVTNAQLEELFSRHSKVKEVVIKKTNAVIGYVEMSNLEEAEDAKNELDGYEFKGHILEVHLPKLPGLMDLKPTRDLGAGLQVSDKYGPRQTYPGASVSIGLLKMFKKK
ncbi:MAG: RNA-binding protein [Methanophagales archaeon]|nr:RNA-binding protein [Methanophagales archaeon]